METRARSAVVFTALIATGLALLSSVTGAPAYAAEPGPADLQLVTLTSPGTAGSTSSAADLLTEQDAVLAGLNAGEPVYRWTTALNGFAVALAEEQVEQLRADPRVALVEPNVVHELAAAPRAAALGSQQVISVARRGGAGVVIGVVDSGIWPESPSFADTPGLGREPARFRGGCDSGEDWATDVCNRKLVGAAWYVSGFGADRVRASESLSPRDVTGHGTHVASLAAGNARVSVPVGLGGPGVFSGLAPQARVAAYKACWSAPDPGDDGCATADLVAAIDRATADRVDVLNLSVTGSAVVTSSGQPFNTVARALLGAAEADIVVVAAAGNHANREYAAHAGPWVTTVGALTGSTRQARVQLTSGLRVAGASLTRRATRRAPIVLAAEARAAGAATKHARQCRDGALDAAVAHGAIVVCVRGGVGRIDKSAAVRRAGGIAMVLVNRRGADTVADLHAVPTVHLNSTAGRRLIRALRHHSDAGEGNRRGAATARLDPVRSASAGQRAAAWSAPGDPAGPVVKPDLVAPGAGVLGASPPVTGRRWSTLTGTSSAAAEVAGMAATVRARHRDWSAVSVRSALTTSTAPVRGGDSPLRVGSGRLHREAALRPGLVFRLDRRAYRAWLAGDLPTRSLNTASILTSGHGVITRRVTNVGTRAMYYSSAALGFAHHDVQVTPAALRLRPGQTGTFRVWIRPEAGAHRPDSGTVRWLGAQGTTVRVPVVIGR